MSHEPLIVTDFERADPQTVAELGRLGSATVHEAYRKRGILHGLTGVVPGARAAGPAVTCLNYPGDNLMLQAAVELCRPGDVLVVALTAPAMHGMLGDLLATACVARELAGVVIDSGVRDVDELRMIGLPVFSRGVSQQGTAKAGLGYINTPVSCGGTVVNPGDVIVADSDGVVAVERDAAPRTLELARERESTEARVRAELGRGARSLDGAHLATLRTGGVRGVEALDPR